MSGKSNQQAANRITVKGARLHNLKNVDLELPRDQLVVVTGVSGSGKSSLVFDTLYAEGHRKYVESLSSYARQFLQRMDKPDVDYITGLSPAIAIEQRTISSNPRSTVGSITEIIDYMRLLFARVGKVMSPTTHEEVTYDRVTDVVDAILEGPEGEAIYILAPIPDHERGVQEELKLALQKGFTRLFHGGEILDIEEVLADESALPADFAPVLLIDRFKRRAFADSQEAEDFKHRVADSVQVAYNEAMGEAHVLFGDERRVFSERFEQDGITFEEPSVSLFNSNNPYGACPTCEGFGRVMGIDEELVIPNPYLSVREGAIKPWQTVSQEEFQFDFEAAAPRYDFPLDTPYIELTPEQKKLLWRGSRSVRGINDFFNYLETQTHKVQYRVMLARYRGYTTCPDCEGKRLRQEALYVKVHGYDFGDLQGMDLEDLYKAFSQIPFTDHEHSIGKRIIYEIQSRLEYLLNVGVGYLQLNRRANTLSGGETQRINLATSLGSTLTGSLYILDEPTIGLHSHDNKRLVTILERLRASGNSVIVVEHDETVMRRADFLVDMGPAAGEHGGQVVHAGTSADVLKAQTSLTAQYLMGTKQVPTPTERRAATDFVEILGASENNLRNVDIKVPMNTLTLITGVSGSGKTTFVKELLYPGVSAALELASIKPGRHRELRLPKQAIANVEMVDQKSAGRNARSNPVTYVGAYDHIRELYAEQPQAKTNALKAASFSFNVDGGRCDTCQGEGYTTVEMQFLPDIKLLCDTCQGKRFKQVVLEVLYAGKNIYEVLDMTVTEAIEFFAGKEKIVQRLQQLVDVGLGYLRLGQSTGTLSGGEAQRLKLASFLQKKPGDHTLYIFDEPTTGLHFEDIAVLMKALNDLVNKGNTVVVIEHNLDVIKCADWIVDLGPGGGKHGGLVVYQGDLAGILHEESSLTGHYLNEKLARDGVVLNGKG